MKQDALRTCLHFVFYLSTFDASAHFLVRFLYFVKRLGRAKTVSEFGFSETREVQYNPVVRKKRKEKNN